MDFCDLHQRADCRLCDECGHEAHLWAPAYEVAGQPAVAEFIYANATCWAENICGECDPELHAQALALVATAVA